MFDYDAVYDDLKAVERQKHEESEKDRLERKVYSLFPETGLIASRNTWINY